MPLNISGGAVVLLHKEIQSLQIQSNWKGFLECAIYVGLVLILVHNILNLLTNIAAHI